MENEDGAQYFWVPIPSSQPALYPCCMTSLCRALAVFFCAGTVLHAQASRDSTEDGQSHGDSGKVVALISVGGEYLNKEAWGGRIYASGGIDYLQLSPFSWSFVRDPRDGVVKLSMNPLFGTGALLMFGLWGGAHGSGPWFLGVVSLALLVPQVLPNLTVQVPVVPKYLYVAAGQRTDYYLFNDVARIYSEGYVGARLLGGESLPISAEVRYVWPLSRGFLENKKPYIGVGLSLALLRTEEGSR